MRTTFARAGGCWGLLAVLILGPWATADAALGRKGIEALRERAGAATAARRYGEAITALRKLVAGTSDPAFVRQLADVYAWAGRLAQAVTAYERYLALRPADEAARLAMASALSWMKEPARHAKALELFDAHLATHPADTAVLRRRAQTRAAAGRVEDALADWRALLARTPKDRVARLALAGLLASVKDAGRLAEALALYDDALREKPRDVATRLQRARVRSWAGRLAEAAEDYRAVLVRLPARGAIDAAAVRLELARALSWSKEPTLLEEALGRHHELLRARPGDLDTLLQRARIHGWLGRVAESVADFERYLAARPGPEVRLELARVLQSSKDRPALLRALALYDERLRLRPTDPDALLARARVRGWAGELEGAVLDFDAVLALRDDGAVRLELAALLRGSQQPAHQRRALALYDVRLAQDAGDAQARLWRARLRAWLAQPREAAADFEAYLARTPDEAVTLEYAQALAASRDAANLDRALVLYDQRLAKGDDPALRLQRARTRVWAGRLEEGLADYRAYLARGQASAAVRLELADALSASKSAAAQQEAAALFDAHLAAAPDDDAARLKRARVRAWAGDSGPAVLDYRAYLAKHPGESAVRLELAQVLGGDKDPARQREALDIYTRHLAASAGDDAVRLRRARLRGWLGEHAAAATELREYLSRHDEGPVRAELAAALAESGRLDEASAEYARAAAQGARSPEHRLQRARLLLWRGQHDVAEQELGALLGASPDGTVKTAAHVELARLYAQTERSLRALEVLDDVLGREPGHAAAAAERERLAREFRTAIVPGFFAYTDRNGINLFETSLDAPIYAGPRLNATLHGSVWRLSDGATSNWAQRLDVGLQARPGTDVELAVGLGPRISPSGTTGGFFASTRWRPSRRFQLTLRYAYDDIYQELYQPNALGVRGSAVQGDIVAELPYRIALQVRAVGRWVEPTNNDFESSWTFTIPVVGNAVRVGYYGQWLGWLNNSISYWSPQAYTAHLGIVRISHEFKENQLSLDGQLSMGTAAERVRGLTSAGFGLAFGVGGALVWRARDWLVLRAGCQLGSTVREQVVERPAASPGGAPTRVSQGNTYWWATPYASLTFVP